MAIRIVLFMHHPLAPWPGPRVGMCRRFSPDPGALCHRRARCEHPSASPRDPHRSGKWLRPPHHECAPAAILEPLIAHSLENQPERPGRRAARGGTARKRRSPTPAPTQPDALTWQRAPAARGTPHWLDCDCFFAENHAYRTPLRKLSYWQSQGDHFAEQTRGVRERWSLASARRRRAHRRARPRAARSCGLRQPQWIRASRERERGVWPPKRPGVAPRVAPVFPR